MYIRSSMCKLKYAFVSVFNIDRMFSARCCIWCSPHAPIVLTSQLLCCGGGVLCFLFRIRELLAARMVVKKFLPFSFFSSDTTWQELIGTVTAAAKEAPFPALTSRRVKHLLVEMFVATKKVSGVLRPALHLFLSAFSPLYSPLVSRLSLTVQAFFATIIVSYFCTKLLCKLQAVLSFMQFRCNLEFYILMMFMFRVCTELTLFTLLSYTRDASPAIFFWLAKLPWFIRKNTPGNTCSWYRVLYIAVLILHHETTLDPRVSLCTVSCRLYYCSVYRITKFSMFIFGRDTLYHHAATYSTVYHKKKSLFAGLAGSGGEDAGGDPEGTAAHHPLRAPPVDMQGFWAKISWCPRILRRQQLYPAPRSSCGKWGGTTLCPCLPVPNLVVSHTHARKLKVLNNIKF